MTLAARIRTHKLSPQASLCASGFNPLSAESPAIEAMTDFGRIQAVTIAPTATIPEANARMIAHSVRMLMVQDRNDNLLGLITARDILGEKPMQLAQARSCKPGELTVSEVMTAIDHLDTLYLGEVLNARVSDILTALKQLGRQHILVEDIDQLTGLPRVRGLFSSTHIGRLLGIPVLGFDLPRSFAEIEAVLAH
ncbi:MAG: hypothetical protein RIR00_1408 [Pseudomonadota bacterium]|jgi:CBS domain-containing protein